MLSWQQHWHVRINLPQSQLLRPSPAEARRWWGDVTHSFLAPQTCCCQFWGNIPNNLGSDCYLLPVIFVTFRQSMLLLDHGNYHRLLNRIARYVQGLPECESSGVIWFLKPDEALTWDKEHETYHDKILPKSLIVIWMFDTWRICFFKNVTSE